MTCRQWHAQGTRSSSRTGSSRRGGARICHGRQRAGLPRTAASRIAACTPVHCLLPPAPALSLAWPTRTHTCIHGGASESLTSLKLQHQFSSQNGQHPQQKGVKIKNKAKGTLKVCCSASGKGHHHTKMQRRASAFPCATISAGSFLSGISRSALDHRCLA